MSCAKRRFFKVKLCFLGKRVLLVSKSNIFKETLVCVSHPGAYGAVKESESEKLKVTFQTILF